jgi:benzoyl-CoA reductase subunit B
MSGEAWENLLQSVTAVRDFHKRWFERTRDQVLAGEPFAICNGDEIEEVLNLMGIPVLIMNNWNYEIIAHRGQRHFSQLLHDRGYPGEHMFALGYASSLDPGKAPWGGLPRPSVIVSGGKYEMELRVSELWARHYNCPVYAMDFMFSTPFKALPPGWWNLLREHWDQVIDPHRLTLRVEQEKAFIRFMEQQTGRTFSFDALVRAMSLINEQMDLWHEAQALIASTRPCPVSVRDQMRVYQAMWHRGTPHAVEMIGNYLAEIKARVAQGVAAHPGEKIRLYYNGRVPPWHEQIGRRYGAVTVACSYTGIPDLYARNMHDGDPFPAMASRHVFLFAQGPELIIDVARAHQCDAVIGIEANLRAEHPSIEQTSIESAGLPYLPLPRDSDDPEIVNLVSNFIEQRVLRPRG